MSAASVPGDDPSDDPSGDPSEGAGDLTVEQRPLSALPSVGVRIGAFVAICLSGLAGALIGSSLVSLQCDGDCGVPIGVGLLVGAVVAAGGMAIVAILVMRALGEWREVQDRERAGHAPADPF
ncbi:MAG: hypothetical protein AAGG08_14650 [Actinomycetota bacterium]